MNFDLLMQVCDAAIIADPASLYYLSGFENADAVVVITKGGNHYLTNPLYEVAVKSSVRRELRVTITDRSTLSEVIRGLTADCTPVGIEYDHLTYDRFLDWGISDRTTVNIAPVLKQMRSLKASSEIAIICEAEGIVDKAYAASLSEIRPGITERRLRDVINANLIRFGAEGTSFDTIVAFGENAAMPHAVPSDRVLREGDCVLMDFGAKYKGYCSDFTRTVSCGQPSERFREAYRVVLDAQLAAIDYLSRGGRSAREADRVARDIVDASPFKGRFNHTLGHGVGIEIHENPSLSQKSEDTLKDGMVFTVEPGVYLEGEFGIRIESLVKIENGELTVIDRSDKEINIV